MAHLAFFDDFTIGKKSRFHHRTGGDNENIANFQGAPFTFDQDCRIPHEIVSGMVDLGSLPKLLGGKRSNPYLLMH